MTLSDLERRDGRDPIFPEDFLGLQFDQSGHVNHGESSMFLSSGGAPAHAPKCLGSLFIFTAFDLDRSHSA